MSELSRRRFLFLGSRKGQGQKSREREEARAADPEIPQPSAQALAWQREQGAAPPGGSALPGVISWLADYVEEPALPRPARSAPLLRPPGAIDESAFLERCTRCGDCAQACPHDAIEPAPAIHREAAGTPRIDPARTPCWLCSDLPCISACETGALIAEAPPMGKARVQRFDCLGSMGTSCSSCQEQCPVEGALAIREGIPVVSEELCTGCGVCHYVCPAPNKAIAILPRAEGSQRAGGGDVS